MSLQTDSIKSRRSRKRRLSSNDSSSVVRPKKSHCTCCHVCHVSMKQRPRPTLACTQCNIIICKPCLQERWSTNQWIASPANNWVCHKCRGVCVCKGCRNRKQRASRKSAHRFASTFSVATLDSIANNYHPHASSHYLSPSASSDEELSELSTDRESISSRRRRGRPSKRQKRGSFSFSPYPSSSSPSPHVLRQQAITSLGLGSFLFDSNSSAKQKIEGLLKRKQRCLSIMQQMKDLMVLLESEEKFIAKEVKKITESNEPTSLGKNCDSPQEKPKSNLVRTSEFPLL